RDVDPVGACVGMKGSRVQSIIRELRGEKIDIIEHSDDLVTFAQSALAPAKITRVSVTHHSTRPHLDVIVEDEQLSLAIGKRGQNVRLASELISSKIDIKSESDVKDEVAGALARMLQTAVSDEVEPSGGPATTVDWSTAPGIGPKTAEAIQAAGFETCEDLLAADPEALEAIDGVGPKTAEAILDWAAEQAEKPPAETAEVGFEAREGPATSSMDGDEFMAALSKALKESEELRAADAALEEEELRAADAALKEEEEKAPASDEEEGS
ncbi:MAG: transcription termination/antitermination protein NusA, partial [bacterium]|nr:transcription termination/antitermination protein NusA [bacterium]